jgi:peroxiredoxin Q/BCP
MPERIPADFHLEIMMSTQMARAGVLLCLFAFTSRADEPPAADTVADFTLTDGTRQFRLSDVAGRYVALHLLLPADCPYCIRHLADYEQHAPAVAGVVHIMVKQGPAADFAAWRAKLSPEQTGSVPVFRDPDGTLARRFNIPDGYEFYGHNAHYPALIVLGPDRRELFRYVGRDNSDRMPFAEFAARMADVTRDPALSQFNLSDAQPAIHGYDPVSYFSGTPRQGTSDLPSTYRGATYHFADENNRQLFAADPERYLPEYGGWCATAMADGGRKVEIDPLNHKVTNGRLFLFYKGWKGDALKEWNKDEPNLTHRADAAWQKLVPPADSAADRR